MKKKYRLFSGIVLLLFCGIIAGVVWFISPSKAVRIPPSAEAYSAFPKQTDVQNAAHLFDENGVAILDIKEVGKVYNPAFVALYALTYAGVEDYFASGIQPDMQKLRNSCDWLVAALKKTPGNRYVWYYDFDSTYNDVSIQAPWFSAFGQAVGIEALCAGYEKLKEEKYLLAAQQAADVLMTPLKDGGVLYARNGLHFFEEIPAPQDNPSHILNGHMRAMLALYKLYQLTDGRKYLDAFRKGAESLKRLLPLYDTGYAYRYDLNPRKTELLFRFNDPYNMHLPSLPISSIRLYDPLSEKTVTLDVGSDSDAQGRARIAGNDWTLAARDAGTGKSYRLLREKKDLSNPLMAPDGGMNAPGTYFYLPLPGDWTDNLRTEIFELIVEYRDICSGNVSVEMRTMAPGAAFRPLRDGDLLLTGSGEWREWRIPLRVSDLGYWCGNLYAEKHAVYLEKLAGIDKRFESYAHKARGYYNLSGKRKIETFVTPKKQKLPMQTTMVPVLDLDGNGVVMAHYPAPETRFINGIWDKSSSKGKLQYQPFLIALQALGIDYKKTWNLTVDMAPAYKWFAEHVVLKNGCALWYFQFDNAYNDVFTKAPWTSSFSHLYILKALKQALDQKKDIPGVDLEKLYTLGLKSLTLPLEEGGFVSFSDFGEFLEEVPNGTHVLNAHLATAAELKSHLRAGTSYDAAVNTLKNTLHLYDAGYWLRYDQNPKKEFLMQIDWVSGKKSPLIASVALEDPQNGKAVKIDSSQPGNKELSIGISGTDWNVRYDGLWSFANGYERRAEAVAGGTRHNVYLRLALPEWHFKEWFQLPEFALRIFYKDVAPGRFAFKIQSICNGNQLEFVPIRNGVLDCKGDGRWKEAVFRIRPQDLGWFVGSDYQKYVCEQLETLGKDDWFFRQYALRQRYFLDATRRPHSMRGNHVPKLLEKIGENSRGKLNIPLKVISSGKVYTGFEVEKSLDDILTDYTAFFEKSDMSFLVELASAEKNITGEVTFFDDCNYGKNWKVEAFNAENAMCAVKEMKNGNAPFQFFEISSAEPIKYLKFSFTEFVGQNRLLLRRIQIAKPLGPEDKISYRYSVGAKLRCDSVRLDFSRCAFLPRKLEAHAIDKHKKVYEKLFSISDNCSPIVDIPVNKSFALLNLSLSDFGRNPHCSAGFSPEISFIFDEKELEEFKKTKKLLSKEILSSTDERNPLSIIRVPITEFYRSTADKLLAGQRNWSDFDKIMKFMEHITYFSVGIPTQNKPEHVLLEKIGACGDFSNVLVALAAVSGIKGRVITLANYPERLGHVVTEIFIDGKWRLFDPTYGLYFKDSKTGDIMSFEELRDAANKAVPVYINKARYAQSGEQTGWGTQRVYLYANPAGPVGVDKPMFYPLVFDCKKNVLLNPPDLSYQGANYIGAAMINSNWLWTLKNLTVGRKYLFVITPARIGGESNSGNFQFTCQVSGKQTKEKFDLTVNRRNLKPLEIPFTADSPEMTLKFTHPYLGPEFHYLSISKIQLKEITPGK